MTDTIPPIVSNNPVEAKQWTFADGTAQTIQGTRTWTLERMLGEVLGFKTGPYAEWSEHWHDRILKEIHFREDL